MQPGIVIRTVGGFCDVQTETGEVLRCLVPGKIKREHQRVLVGDRVYVRATTPTEVVVEQVLPRTRELVRPPVANADVLVVVNSVAYPAVNLVLLDRLLLAAHQQDLECIICWNKVDLAEESPQLAQYIEAYAREGYKCVRTSAVRGDGIDELTALLSGSIAVLAGDSGVGKSALFNRLLGERIQEEGDVSHRLRRGRHTTREVVLYPLPKGGFIADTPGFTRISLSGIEPVELDSFFFSRYLSNCYYPDCRHRDEPDCAIKEAVAQGEIPAWRYDQYLTFLEELEVIMDEQWK